jgi:septation ring formation regulator EzrA
MEIAQTLILSVVVAAVGSLLAWTTTGQFHSLHRELDARFNAIDAKFEAIDARFEAIDDRFSAVDHRLDAVERRIERIERSFDGLRSDLTQVALAVGARPRAENG